MIVTPTMDELRDRAEDLYHMASDLDDLIGHGFNEGTVLVAAVEVEHTAHEVAALAFKCKRDADV